MVLVKIYVVQKKIIFKKTVTKRLVKLCCSLQNFALVCLLLTLNK